MTSSIVIVVEFTVVVVPSTCKLPLICRVPVLSPIPAGSITIVELVELNTFPAK